MLNDPKAKFPWRHRLCGLGNESLVLMGGTQTLSGSTRL
jgi:hypothetical protein